MRAWDFPGIGPSATRHCVTRSPSLATDIALGQVFQNMSHFSRFFRNHLGLASSDFRRQASA